MSLQYWIVNNVFKNEIIFSNLLGLMNFKSLYASIYLNYYIRYIELNVDNVDIPFVSWNYKNNVILTL